MSDEKVDDRRRGLVKHLSILGRDTKDWITKASAILASTPAAVARDLIALEAGELPAGVAEEEKVTAEQLSVADLIESANTDAEIDEVMKKLAAGVIRGTLPKDEAKVAQFILMGRRQFLAYLRAVDLQKKGGEPITVRMGPELRVPGVELGETG